MSSTEIPSFHPVSFGSPRELSAKVKHLEQRFTQQSSYMTRDRLQEVADTLQLLHQGEISEIPNKRLRLLPWALNHGEPQISKTPALLTAFHVIKDPCRPKSLMGLISCFLSARDLPGSNYLAWISKIQGNLKVYSGKHPDLLHWKGTRELLFVPDGANRTAKWCLSHSESISKAFKDLAPPSSQGRVPWRSPLFSKAISGVIQAIAASKDFPARVPEVLALLEENATEHLKLACDAFLVACSQRGLERQEEILDVALRHFGDPRLERSTKWLGISQEARELCKQWVSLADLELFFSSVAMDEDRRRFWLQYVDQMSYSRIALGNDVVRRSDPALQNFLKQHRHAILDNGDPTLSAAIFRIKNMLIVEFSHVGHACYIYDHDNVPFDMDSPVFADSVRFARKPRTGLKDSRIADRIIHNGAWHYGAYAKLSEYGIHRTQGRRY